MTCTIESNETKGEEEEEEEEEEKGRGRVAETAKKKKKKTSHCRFCVISTLSPLSVLFLLNFHPTMQALNARTCSVSSSTARVVAAAPRRTPSAVPIPSSSSRRRQTIASAATGGGPSLLQKLGRVFSEKATADIERVFKGASKTREKLGVSLWRG